VAVGGMLAVAAAAAARSIRVEDRGR